MLELKNLTVKRGDLTVADHINVRFEEGKVYTVLGPNGTGKSSMLKTIFGELPHEGMITYQGKQLERTKLADWRKPIGYMPQDSRVDASLTALEVVLLGRMDSLTMRVSDELLTEAASIMAQLGIGHLAHRDILNLSGGQRQMVMFAQVLLREPQNFNVGRAGECVKICITSLILLEEVLHLYETEKSDYYNGNYMI